MNVSTLRVPKDGLMESFVYVDEVIEDSIIDAKYWGTDNFIGRRIDGYDRPLVVMSGDAANACAKVADILRGRGFLLKIFDAYRPQKAVNDFVRWAEDTGDICRKPIHYPEVDKRDFFKLGYVAKKSGHTRGSAVDLTVVDIKTRQELDMGTIFDFMGPRSHLDAKDLTELQKANRAILSEAMQSCGFETYAYEWWHFSLKNEPHPNEYFDFPIR
ncbi:D-alanyl-D-alanine dipeptidase [Synergistales bacterium]|nr:D-alanyl-D-alanine dipeptidase [Synergistales bacterium]